MVLIYIVRHGETDVNTSDKVNDVNIDTSINATGKKQAKKTATYLKNIRKLNAANCDIYTSPSMRAVETASIIKNTIDKKIKLHSDDRLLETDKGVLSGLSKTDPLMKKYNNSIDKAMKKRMAKADTLHRVETVLNVLNDINPKFSVEPLIHISKRLKSFFSGLPTSKPNIVIVTHSGIITSILVDLLNIRQVMMGDISKGKNCTITAISKIGKTKPEYTLLTFPNTEHL
jgi:broad specificity phosphatase PhoE